MFVQTENTPNENALKFIPGNIPISPDKPIDFPNKETASEISNLASKLFDVEGVKRVFFGSNFITITKDESLTWEVIKPHIFMTIVEYMTNGWAIFNDDKVASEFKAVKEKESKSDIFNKKPDFNDPVIKEIISLIDERVRPAVAMDGGDINFVNFIDGIVYVEMTGACNGCSSADATLKNGIKTMLQHYIPEVQDVVAAN